MGSDFLRLGQDTLHAQYMAAFEQLALGDHVKKVDLIDRFNEHISRRMATTSENPDANELAPYLSWTRLDGNDSLAQALSQVHKNPTRAAGGERNHKTGKMVHLYNSKQISRVLPARRTEKFLYYMIRSVDMSLQEESKEEDDFLDNSEDIFDEDDLDSFTQLLSEIAAAAAMAEF
ncbi:hypothetical protein AC1031_015189 [Aphanomyces cochlioides]|nr:hypothetical protein AC1031_015189 [Aphanomyces cochlioides]